MDKKNNISLEEKLKAIISSLPERPGSYQYWNAEGIIIYVGKAKNLKKRVSSYFTKNHDSMKTRMLVSKIADITYTTVNTEEDALNLENKLIKKYKPRYNVLLKDDKTYPFIAIQKSEYPRVYKTRNLTDKGANYYGPYTHVSTMYALLELIKQLYPIRNCHHQLTEESIKAGKYKVCLEYHIGNCEGPCIGKQSKEEYNNNISQIREILKGNTRKLEQQLMMEMNRLAENLEFEEAELTKKRYLLLKNYNAKSEVVNYKLDNIDVFSIEENEDGKSAYINYMHVKNGGINQSFTFEYKKRLDESKEELMSLGISEMRERFGSKAKEIIVPFDYKKAGCKVYGGKWIDTKLVKEEYQHFNGKRKDGCYLFCVGVPESFLKMENVILENIRTAEKMLIAYELYQTGETRSLELNAYSHGTKGINEYAKDKKRYKGK